MSNTSGFIGGMTAGLLVGAAITMVMDPVSDRQRKRLYKKTAGIFRSIGSVVDTAMEIMR